GVGGVGEGVVGGGGDGGRRRRRLVWDSEVDLVARVWIEVEGIGRMQVREGVRAGRDGLRLERFRRPRLRHLGRDDAAQVEVEVDDVDDPYLWRSELQHAQGTAVAAVVERERRRAGPELQRVRQGGRLGLWVGRIG